MQPRGTTAASSLIRDDLRRRRRLVVTVGVLVGLIAGVGSAAIAGARRTDSSFPRHLEASQASDVEIDPGSLDPAADAALRSLPGVEEASWWATTGVYLLDEEGQVREETVGLLTITSDGRYLDMDRVTILEGRRVDDDAPDEIMINRAAAVGGGVEVGDRLPLGWLPFTEEGFPDLEQEPQNRIDAEVVGIMALNEDVVTDQLEAELPRLYVSPAYLPPQPGFSSTWYGFSWYGLRLTDGQGGADEAITAWNEAADAHNATIDEAAGDNRWLSVARRTEDMQTKADKAVRPLVIALATFGLVLVVTVTFLASQALTRSARQELQRKRILRELGIDRSTLVATALAVPVATATLGALLATTIGWLASSRFPVGPFTALEPDPGRHGDLAVLGPSLVFLLVVPVGVTFLTASRETARLLRPTRPSDRSSRLTTLLARSGAPGPMTAAVRLTAPGRGDSYVPTRSVLVSTVVIVAVLTAGLVFGENLRSLGERPERFGWAGDSLVMSDGGYGGFDEAGAEDYVASRDDITGWRLIAGDRTFIDGRPTPGLAYGPGEGRGLDYAPVLIEGRAPRGPGEVVLGRATLDASGRDIGDTVHLGPVAAGQEATIVGTAIFPTFGPLLAAHTGLGVGAWVDPRAGAFNFIGTDFGPPYNGLLLDLAAGVVPSSSLQEFDVFGVVQPTEVATTTDAVRYQPALVAALAVTGLLSILFTLTAVVRRRRTELGTYRVLGFTPRQLRATIGLQGLVFAGAAVLIGTPVGVVAGRQLWRQFAAALGVAETTDPATGPVAVAAVAVLAVGLLSAVVPAVVAGRHPHRPNDRRD